MKRHFKCYSLRFGEILEDGLKKITGHGKMKWIVESVI